MPRLPLQWSWLHACLAVQSDANRLTLVINGVEVLDKVYPPPASGETDLKPTSLSGKVILGKVQIIPNRWYQNRMLVTNLNVFSGLLPVSKMKQITFGEDCGKAEGDYLAWRGSDWRLEGGAQWREVGVKDICEREESVQFFDQYLEKMTDCKQLCSKLHDKGRIPSITTQQKLESLVSKMKENFIGQMWGAATRSENGSWVDIYSGEGISDAVWGPGFPDDNPRSKCAIVYGKVKNWGCQISGGRGGRQCSCHFPMRPYLRLRGLCKNSNFDQLYLPRNAFRTIAYYGTIRTLAMFNGTFWQMKTNYFNTTAFSNAPDISNMLGKYNWTIEGDSLKCEKGKSHTRELKLTGCMDGQFTCDDGQCIEMEERCNQVPDCRDKSDENYCQLIVFENNYNKNIPPIGRTVDGDPLAANVSISITLMNVVEIEERHHSIHLQFSISLQWRENRVKYQNLKNKTSLNALSDNDISKLWLPLVIYDNTDQKQSTRLGEYGNGEWITRLTVVREGKFRRSSVDEVDEAEIFEGEENTLMMTQIYTHKFQCNYKLQKYPFDAQVKMNFQINPGLRCVPSKWVRRARPEKY